MSYRFLDLEGAKKALQDNREGYLKFVKDELQANPFNGMRESFEEQIEGDGPLKDIPFVIKDNICLKGYVAGCSSKYLENHQSHYTATVLERLMASGCKIMGRTNMDEFAMGSTTEHSAYGPSLNPWDTKRVPGGSSGGSAVMVASGVVPVALGSDTGGSVRQPASLCGVVGYKPSYGLLSRYGLVAFSSSLDQIGLFSRNVPDCAEVMGHIVGLDQADSTSTNIKFDPQLQDLDFSQITVGVLPDTLLEALQPEIADSLKKTKQWFESKGAQIKVCDMSHFDKGIPVYYIVALAEASANLARYDGIRYGHRADKKDLSDIFLHSRQQALGTEVKRRILMGTYVLSSEHYDAYYAAARKVQTLIKADFDKAFSDVDVMLWPTTPTTAYEFGSMANPVEVYLSDIFTVCVNLAALPSISVPSGVDENGLPIGMQFTGAFADDTRLLSIAAAYEQDNPFEHKPVIS